MSRIKIISVAVVTVITVGALLFLLKSTNSPYKSGLSSVADFGFFKSPPPDNASGKKIESVQSPTSNTATPAKTYTNPELGFSFNHPEGLNVSGFAEGEIGYTILAQKPGSRDPSASSGREAFQIFISEFDESGPITPERIKQDLPDMAMEDPKPVRIGSDKKLEALIFFSQNQSLGRTREVWFIHEGSLYQVTTYADLDNLIGPILETLTFK